VPHGDEKTEAPARHDFSEGRENLSHDKTEAQEIEITEEMIEAGAAVLCHSSFYLSSEETIAKNVYKAMRLVSPTRLPPRAGFLPNYILD